MRTRLSLVVLVLALVAILAWPAGASAQTDPSLKLAGPGGTVKLPRFGGGWVPLDVSAWVAATGGDFELRVARPDYDSPIGIDQVDPNTGVVLRDLPEDVLDNWSGLSGFIQVIVRNSQGVWAGGGLFNFCPNSWERQRVDDSGPDLPRYPTSCGAFSPFSKGMVWGIDSGWATHAFGSEFEAPMIRLRREGTFTITIRITRRYIDLLEIPEADAQLTFTATVKNRRGGFGEGFRHGAARPAAATARPDRGARHRRPRPRHPPRPRRAAAVVDEHHDPARPRLPRVRLHALERGPGATRRRGLPPHGRGGHGRLPVLPRRKRRRGRPGPGRRHALPPTSRPQPLALPPVRLLHAPRRGDMEVVRSRKQAFCLAPTDPIDITVERADWSPFDGLGTMCGSRSALWVREVLQAGWGDMYFQSVPASPGTSRTSRTAGTTRRSR